MVGTTTGHCHILEKLGEGGVGVVYKTTDTRLNGPVALRFLPVGVAAGSSKLDRFNQEAKAAAAPNHPNICMIYGIEEADAGHLLAMEFEDGQTLQEEIYSLEGKAKERGDRSDE
jgi:non-specific serine/threonine protein kinase